jgi:L-cysteine/cystine lyase
VTLEEARAQFPVLERYAYLNAGSTGPLPQAAVDAFRARLEHDLSEGRSGSAYIEEMIHLRERVRRKIAAVLGTSAELVALADSTTRGCQIAVAGLGLGSDDEIVTSDEEHFGCSASSMRAAPVSWSPRPPRTRCSQAVTPRTRLIAVSHVLWTTGRRVDLERLRQPDGPPLLVDGAQSAGAISVDLAGADFYTVSAHKWLCGPEPSGALFVRDPERLRVALPSAFSAESHDDPDGSFVPKDGARRFDSGWIGAPALAGLEAALGVHPDWRYEGAAEAAAGCRELLAPLVDVVTPAGQSTLVSFRPPGDPAALVAALASSA